MSNFNDYFIGDNETFKDHHRILMKKSIFSSKEVIEVISEISEIWLSGGRDTTHSFFCKLKGLSIDYTV